MKKRLQAVQERLNRAAEMAKRDPAAITLVGVSKTWPAEALVEAYAAGLRHFGENRPEELAAKRPQVEALLGEPDDITWHHIGTVQSRKSKLVASHADVFHALERLKIAERLSKQRRPEQGILPVFLEVNVSGEASKAGFAAQKWAVNAEQRQALLAVLRAISQLPNLRLMGLMTMAPWGASPEATRAVFRRTRELATWLNETLPDVALSHLSMGMSGDFELAVAEGATHVRVGSAIFGSRH